MNLARKMSRRGVVAQIKKGDVVIAEKRIGAWWEGKRAELAEKNRAPNTALHPLDRRIARAIKKATNK